MPSKMRTLCVTVAAVLVLLQTACGPAHEERDQARDAERQQAVAAYQQELISFGERHGATPVDLLEMGPGSEALTAQLQEQLEDSVVAFRSELLDIVRTSQSEYQLILSVFGGTVVTLNLGSQDATKLLADPDRFWGLLVAAEIEKVVPLTLKLESCTEPDCMEVRLRPNLLFNSYRIFGKAIAVESER